MLLLILAMLTTFATSSLFATQVQYPAGEEPVKLTLHGLLSNQVPRPAYSKEEKKAEAMALYLKLMREDERNVWAPFQLAAFSAEQNRVELAERYLQVSAKRGLWYYYNLLENRSFAKIKTSNIYQSILAETKIRYQQYAPQFEGKAQYTVPEGEPPAGGWPTVIYLHPYGKAPTISQEEKALFANIGVVCIKLNGTQMLAEESFRWSTHSEKSTQKAIQRTLKELSPTLHLNHEQVYLTARGQGALHGANLIAKYSQFYAGALLIAPEGIISPASYSKAKNKRIMITYYERQKANEQELALHFAKLFKANNSVKTQHFDLGEDAMGGWQARFTQPLHWMLGKNLDAV